MAVIPGKVWHRPDKAGQYFIVIDLDKLEAINEFCTRNEKTIPLTQIALKFIVEQHLDDESRAHVCFYSPTPFVKKSADSYIGIEVKGLGEHGISNCTPSIHKNKDPRSSNECRYQILIKPILPLAGKNLVITGYYWPNLIPTYQRKEDDNKLDYTKIVKDEIFREKIRKRLNS